MEQSIESVQNSKHIWTTIVIIIVATIVIGGGVYAWQKSNLKSTEQSLRQKISVSQNQISQPQQMQTNHNRQTDQPIAKQDNQTIIQKKPAPKSVNEYSDWKTFKEKLKNCSTELANLAGNELHDEIIETYQKLGTDCEVANAHSNDYDCYIKVIDGCYAELGQQTGDFKYCEKIKSLQEKEKWCYYEIGYAHKNVSACEKITTENWRNSCFLAVSLETVDITICQKISDEEIKNDCINEITDFEQE